jgi:hypothetical protein
MQRAQRRKTIPENFLVQPNSNVSADFARKDGEPFFPTRIAQPDVESGQFPVRGPPLTPMQRGSEL